MAGQVPDNEITRKADADLSAAANRGRSIRLTANNGCALSNAIGGPSVGVLDNLPKAASAARVITGGTAKVRAGAAIAVGDRLKSDANGRLIPVGAEALATLIHVVGIAMQAAAAVDDLVEVRITPYSYVV